MTYAASKRRGAKRQRTGSYTATVSTVKAALRHDNPNPPKRVLSFPQGEQVFRFYASGAKTKYAITRANILNMLVIGQTAGLTTQARVLQHIKVKRVRLWAPPSLSATHLAFEWYGSLLGNGDRVMDDMNVSNTASYISTSPPKGSSDAAFWCASGINEAEVLALLTCPTGTVMDIHCECTVAGALPLPIVNVTTGTNLAAGIIAYNSLDQTANTIYVSTALQSIY